ncbi:cytochrome o ubiquinol oxidase subunit IV [Alicyclobacillus sp. ALC3]|uniref:cytochrome o ubiquinol oxidase subunit IV n=1 Tax=Alicyclobacillus sp. ALC3 TaxID=2796143 RepID=UPI002378CA54|nr:cytochrome C oxidase subunit IV family protein [Alicyclobacillus sp. ALC3]WDL96284.1 cytochrome C oxidase subunit IV family protein [Alicyclobacillus sp. ALC3]
MHASSSAGAPAHKHAAGFPWHHVIGFALSIILTLLALWMVQTHIARASGLLALILVVAALQIGIQLFFFMHVTESPGPKYHVIALSLGIIFTFAVVAGSVWIMTFGGTLAY